MEPSADNAATTDAWNIALDEKELQLQAADSIHQQETVDASRFIGFGHAVFCSLVSEEVERQVADRLQVLVATAVEKNFTNAVHMTTDYVVAKRKFTLNEISNFSLSRMIES